MRLELRTERLVLRRFTAKDADNLWTLHGDPDVMRYISMPPITRAELDRDVVPEYLADNARYPDHGYWAAETHASDFIGQFELHPAVPTEDPLRFWADGSPAETTVLSLGYRLRRSAHGRGYATEGAGALVELAFGRLGATEVCATTMAVNRGSRRVLEKLGLRHVRTARLDWPDPLPGSEHGDVVYRLSRADWLAAGEARTRATPPPR